MRLLYTILYTLGLVLGLPYFFVKAFRHGKYLGHFKDRCGFRQAKLGSLHGSRVWVHAVSVGEVNAVVPLVSRIKKKHPGATLVVSTTTSTGQALAQQKLSPLVPILYFPLDWPFAVRRTLRWVQPQIVCLTETELWPNFIWHASQAGIQLALINGRISTRSFRRYQFARLLMRDLLSHFDVLLMQSEADAERIRELGAPQEKIIVTGNLKYDLVEAAEDTSICELLRQSFVGTSSVVWVAGSTMAGEEAMLLHAFHHLRARSQNVKLILAPRHPERFQSVFDLIERQGFRVVRRTQLHRDADATKTEVLLLDSIGELASVYQLATVVFVGGSLVSTGGHNILEPARHAKPILFGPSMENFRQMAEDFVSHRAAFQVRDGEELVAKAQQLFDDSKLRTSMGEAAAALLRKHAGATDRTLSYLEKLL